jgi:excisionase family DNA binding protein
MIDESLLGSSDACELLEIDRGTLIRWIQTGKITPVGQIGRGRTYVFRRAEIEQARVHKKPAA